MNKNWLYRVLAMALIAMLALPVFAVAEDAEPMVGLTQSEEAVEEEAFDLFAEGEEEEAESKMGVILPFDLPVMDIPTWDEKDWDANDEAFGGNDAWVADGGFYITVSALHDSVTFKSSNKKVATVAKGDSYCFVAFKGAGEAKITVTAKYKFPNHKKKTTFKTVVKIKVKNPGAIEKVKAYYGKPWEFDEDDCKGNNGMWTKDMADGFNDEGYPEKVLWPVAYNDDDKLMDYQTGADIDLPAYVDGYNWTLSNGDSMFFLPGESLYAEDEEYNGVWKLHQTKGYWGINWAVTDPVEFQEAYWDAVKNGGTWDDVDACFMPDLLPVMYKPGKCTVTITPVGASKKKIKVKFKVDKKNKTWSIGKNEHKKVGDNAVLAVKTINQKSIDEVEVTFAFINGTDATYKKTTMGIAILMGEDVYVVGEKSLNVTAKPHKTTTFKVTFKTSGRSASQWVPDEEDLQVVTPGANLYAHNPVIVLEDEWLPSNYEDGAAVKAFVAE